MLKTTLLLALVLVKRMGDLQALSVNLSCLEFGPNDSKIVLKPRHGYIPKVLSTPFRVQVITLSALPTSEQDMGLNLLCPVRALIIYTDLALHTTKMTAQAIGRSMASLVMLECHLWLNLTEMNDAEKVPILDSPVSPTGLFGSAVEG